MGKFFALLSKTTVVILKNPVNMIFAFAFLFFVSKVYIFDGGLTDRLIMYAIIGLWGIWFLLKHLFILLVVVIGLGLGGYIYFTHNQNLKTACEESGGSWNSKTKTCEEKLTIREKVQKFISDYLTKDKEEKK